MYQAATARRDGSLDTSTNGMLAVATKGTFTKLSQQVTQQAPDH